MTNVEISIIVPVYNVEKYLSVCLDSIRKQTFLDWELILVDDGSTDRSAMICDEYSTNDERIHTIHKANEGVAIARNTGIKVAKGKWLTFIDSDDWIDENYLEVMIHMIWKENVDIVFLSNILYEFPQFPQLKCINYISTVYTKDMLWDFLQENVMFKKGDGGSCCKLFCSALIRENNIEFTKGNSLFEDTMFTLNCVSVSTKIAITKNSCYHYRHDNVVSLSRVNKPYIQAIESAVSGFNALNFLSQRTKPRYELGRFYNKPLYIHLLSLISVYRCKYGYKERIKVIELNKEVLCKYPFVRNLDDVKMRFLAYLLLLINYNRILDVILKIIFRFR